MRRVPRKPNPRNSTLSNILPPVPDDKIDYRSKKKRRRHPTVEIFLRDKGRSGCEEFLAEFPEARI
jgi:hypothetical protein